MKQAYQHLKPGTSEYNHISDMIKKCVDTWNSTHNSKADIKVIADLFKTIFKYHHWIKVSDIEPSIDLGLMGEFGENKGLNTETIFNWFKSFSQKEKANELKTHSSYIKEPSFIPYEQRKKTRLSLIKIFMEFWDEYKKTKVYNPGMNHYIPVFFTWFKKLGFIIISTEDENEMNKQSTLLLRDLRSFFNQKKGNKSIKTQKKMFIDHFIIAVENDYPIYKMLNEMKW